MLNLIKKDYLIVKKVWLGVMLVALIIPVFLSFAGGDIIIPAWLTLATMSTLLALILFSSIDEEEEKYPKAKSLITTIGYSRKVQMIKRYVLMMLVFLYTIGIYAVESLFITGLGKLTITSFAISFLVFTIIVALYLSMTTLFGVRAGRYIVMFVITLISVGPAIISKLNIKINLDFVYELNQSILISSMIVFAIMVYFIALKVSINSYNNKEL